MSGSSDPLPLARVEPFSRLDPDEVAVVLAVARARRYAPGEHLYQAGHLVTKVSIVLQGTVEGASGRVVGALAALYGRAMTQDVRAGAEGALCLQVRRGQFFTIVHECPEILGWLLEQPAAARGLT